MVSHIGFQPADMLTTENTAAAESAVVEGSVGQCNLQGRIRCFRSVIARSWHRDFRKLACLHLEDLAYPIVLQLTRFAVLGSCVFGASRG